MKTLCYVNHYFGPSVDFKGGSNWSPAEKRRAIVERCIEGLRQLPGAEVYVCGIPDRSLVPIDIDLSHARANPRTLIYEGLTHMASRVEDYDYFISVEDDILVPPETFQNVLEFDRTSLLNEVLHPNRVEYDPAGKVHVIDIHQAYVGWTYARRPYRGDELRMALNPHSAAIILSREKLRYGLSMIDPSFRGIFIAQEMESAFAYFNSPFLLYRNYDRSTFHTVVHMDPHPSNWTPRPRWHGWVKQVVPPIALRAARRVRRVLALVLSSAK